MLKKQHNTLHEVSVHHAALCLCVSLIGCQLADGAVMPDVAALPPSERAMVDVVFASTLAQAPLRALQAAPPGAGLPEAARLSVTCPFARSSWQLAYALQIEVDRIALSDLDPAARSDWRALQQGLGAHTQTLQLLGIDLSAPGFGDYLFGDLPPGALMTRADLAQSAHPVQDTLPLIRSIYDLTSAYPWEVKVSVEADYASLAAVMGEEATLNVQLRAWHEALQRTSTYDNAPAVQERLREVMAVMEVIRDQGC